MGNAIRFGIYSIVFVLFCFSINTPLMAQEADMSDRLLAFEQIIALKNGALVVRIRTNDKKIELYKNAGKENLAKDLEEKYAERNMEMIKGVKESFTFCPVYFIFSEDFSKVLNGERTGIFLNENLEIDNSITLDELTYFFLDYGSVYAELISNPNSPRNKEVTSTPVQQSALVIKDHNMVQLLSPFPFYSSVKFNEFEKAAKHLSSDCFKFYAKAVSKTSLEND